LVTVEINCGPDMQLPGPSERPVDRRAARANTFRGF